MPQSTGTPRSVWHRQEFTATVADKPTVGTHPARQSFTIGSDTDSIMEAAEQANQSDGSDDGRPVSEVDDEFGSHEEMLVEEEVAPVRPPVAVMRAGFVQLDSWDLRDLFRQRGCPLKSVPRFLWGSFQICLKITLEEILAGIEGGSCFLLLPRMMFHRPPRGGLMGRDKLVARFDELAAGKWHDLILASVKCSADAAVVTRRHRRRGCPNTMEKL